MRYNRRFSSQTNKRLKPVVYSNESTHALSVMCSTCATSAIQKVVPEKHLMLYFLPSHDEVTLLYQIKDSRTGFKPAKEVTEPFDKIFEHRILPIRIHFL